MVEFAKELSSITIEDEMKQSYLAYAMSVIVGRALPDVRDGLKPVHRRVLYAMSELGNDWNKAYKKSARIVGDVIGKYHPHGDTAVYDTIVRMAQPFSLRYMLVDGQGNFGSVDGDPPAAMRYTEVRMAKIAHELLADIDKETVDFIPNYDETEFEPSIFPTRLPNLLINGSSGIAVGMATNIPPHNLTEVMDACIALTENSDLSITDLIGYIHAPDFPTGGIINGTAGIHEAYQTGRGRVYIRAKTHTEELNNGGQSIIVDELPYQVNKARLLERIGELIKEKKVEGISALRDESDKDGMRMVIELKRGEVPEVILNNLFNLTAMQTVFGINMVALIDGRPRLITLKEALDAFIRHRREVVTRRTIYELRKARERAHVLEGLAIALSNIDPIIELIKASSSPQEAKIKLMNRAWPPGLVSEMLVRADAADTRPEDLEDGFGLIDGNYHLSARQAQAILDLRLHRLTGLEKSKILDEYRALLEDIAALLYILRSPDRLMEVIREEFIEIRDKFGDARRSEIITDKLDLTLEDLITEEDVVVTLSHTGYVKSQALSTYQAQNRGGKGKSATKIKDEDFIVQLVSASTHDTVLCFSTLGRLYWLKVYEIPQGSRQSRGKPINNLLPLTEHERITAFLPVREYEDHKAIFMATARGIVKKTWLTEFSRPRPSGKIAINLRDDDELVGVAITDGTADILLFSDNGKATRFSEADVRTMGRGASGVIGMRIDDEDRVISMIVPEGAEGDILTATVNGFGKRTPLDEYPRKGRGGKGVVAIKASERNGKVVSAIQVVDDDEVMLISNSGTLVRIRASDVSSQGRNTQGVTLIKLAKKEGLIGVVRVVERDDAEPEHVE
jgi:DNA gyrase subunit A